LRRKIGAAHKAAAPFVAQFTSFWSELQVSWLAPALALAEFLSVLIDVVNVESALGYIEKGTPGNT
jgi:hypothetical protein